MGFDLPFEILLMIHRHRPLHSSDLHAFPSHDTPFLSLFTHFSVHYVYLQMLCFERNPHMSPIAARILHAAEFKHHISLYASRMMRFWHSFLSMLPRGFPAEYVSCVVWRKSQRREREKKEQNRACKERKQESPKERGSGGRKRVELKTVKERSGGVCVCVMLLAMLVSYYSMAKFVQ